MRYLLFLVLSTMGLAQAALADTSDLEMTGIASYSELRRPYYIGALYLDQPVVSAGQVLSSWGERRMEIRITAQRWTPRRFSSQWTQALILNVGPRQLEKFDDSFVQFNNLPHAALSYGDQIVIESDAKGRTRVSLNSVEMFTESKPGFFEVLLSTWIGDKPPSTEFKQAILGSIDASLLKEYEVLQPTSERKQVIASWMDGSADEAAAEAEQLAAAEAEAKAKEEAQAKALAEAKQKEEDKALAVAAAAAATASAAVASRSAPSMSGDVAAIAESVEVADVVAEPVIPEPVNKPDTSAATVVAMAPTETASEADEPQIDPAIYRLQQETLLKLYRSSIIKRALRQVKYPKSAVRRGQEGIVGLEVTVDRSGTVVDLAQASPSRFKSLNSAAVAAVHDAGDLPAVPAGLEGEQITVSIPVNFKLQ